MPTFLYTSLALFAVWAMLLLLSRPTRREQLVMSLVGLVIAPAALFLAAAEGTSAVQGPIGVEDLIFAVSFFGVAAVAYEALMGVHLHAVRPARKEPKHPLLAWAGRLLLALSFWAAVSVANLFVFELSVPRAAAAGALLVAVYVVAERKDLLLNALISGLFMSALVFLCQQLFFVQLFPGEAAVRALSAPYIVGGVSTDVLLWSAMAGFAIGPLYEYVRRLKERIA